MSDTAGERVVHGSYTDSSGKRIQMTPEQAERLWQHVERKTAERREKYPDEKTCIHAIADAIQRLEELGWSDAIYCPKDGSLFEVIEAGSTGIHQCSYEGKWPDGRWWILDDNDMWPSRPILYRSPAVLPDHLDDPQTPVKQDV